MISFFINALLLRFFLCIYTLVLLIPYKYACFDLNIKMRAFKKLSSHYSNLFYIEIFFLFFQSFQNLGLDGILSGQPFFKLFMKIHYKLFLFSQTVIKKIQIKDYLQKVAIIVGRR